MTEFAVAFLKNCSYWNFSFPFKTLVCKPGRSRSPGDTIRSVQYSRSTVKHKLLQTTRAVHCLHLHSYFHTCMDWLISRQWLLLGMTMQCKY